MPCFKIVHNTNEISLNGQWVSSAKFNSKDRIVDEEGRAVSSDYQGRRYQIIEKRERVFSNTERIGRGFLGVVAVICTLSIALFSKSVRNLFIKSKENIRFGVPVSPNSPNQTPSQVEEPSVSKEELQRISEEELQQGISISEETVAKVRACMRYVLARQEEGGVKLYNSQPKHRVFTLETVPDLIFKMNVTTIPWEKKLTEVRYQKMIDAQTVVRVHQLGLLVVPHAKLFTVVDGETHKIIAEQKMDINPHSSAQEQYFQEYAESLNEAVSQLAIFICKTRYSDVEWRNNPVLNNSLDENGNRKIALIDIEELNSAQIGLFGGGFGRRGLVRCVNEQQGLLVQKVAQQNGIGGGNTSFEDAHNQRIKELEEGRKLSEYYERQNIVVGDEPIQVEESALDFSAYPAERGENLRNLALEVIKAINDKISNSSPDESVKGRRYIRIDTNQGPFAGMGSRLADPSIPAEPYKTNEEYYNATFLGCVVKQLADLGAIYKLVKSSGGVYFIQA